MSQEKLAEECADKRLPISVASIKRAETGKKVLYRTVRGLASYFDITVNQLLESTLPPEHGYSDNNDYLGIGRNQKNSLHSIYQQHIAQREKQGLIINAYYGGGKTMALNFIAEKIIKDKFSQKRISLNKATKNKNHHDKFRATTQEGDFFRKLLNIGSDVSPSVIRHQINKLTQCKETKNQLDALLTKNVLPLDKHTEHALEPHLIEIFMLALRHQQKHALLIDNLHHGSPLIESTIHAMLHHPSSPPLFIAATSTPTLYPPLSHFNTLHLNSLNKPETKAFLQSLNPQTAHLPASLVTNLHIISNGNPGLLQALYPHTAAKLPPSIQQHIRRTLENLPGSAQEGLAEAARNLTQSSLPQSFPPQLSPPRLHLSHTFPLYLINELYMTGLFQLTKNGLVPCNPLFEKLILSVVK